MKHLVHLVLNMKITVTFPYSNRGSRITSFSSHLCVPLACNRMICDRKLRFSKLSV
ncbi:hypothetical protein NECAME_00465 [Necator americanus]|uniref:Uncharacterized protein n=1 Tax=Necator americanus TaxID=51031 RepID=W2T4I5_NECAM|nr:hypothetical protein NECAME_00465 [Necator americanus]ETN76940.1 hypothetical protein NECAME_00465 [Necator americanus]